jgi:hypothetical protein
MNVGPESNRTDALACRGVKRRRNAAAIQPSATLAGQPAEWVSEVLSRLRALAVLDDGWDGNNAPRISPTNVEIAMQLLAHVMLSDTPAPEIVPTVRGGLQLEWHVRNVDVELEILSPGRYLLSFEDRSSERELEVELSSDLSPFAEAVRRVSPGQ